jgi:hypothetical protein
MLDFSVQIGQVQHHGKQQMFQGRVLRVKKNEFFQDPVTI